VGFFSPSVKTIASDLLLSVSMTSNKVVFARALLKKSYKRSAVIIGKLYW